MEIQLKKGIFFSTFSAIGENKKYFSYSIIIDILFFVSLYILGQIFDIISLKIGPQAYKLLFLAGIYYLVLLFIYSLFKYIALSFVKSSFEKHKIGFNKLGKFYLLNIANFIILFLVFLILSFIAASIKETIAPYGALLILLFYAAFAYAFANMSQILFFENKSALDSLRITTRYLLKIKNYYGIYLVVLFSLAIIFLLFTIFGNLLKITIFQNYDALLNYGDIYTIIFVHAVGIIFYLAILFNRFYLYNTIKEKF